MKAPTVAFPITPSAFHRFGVEAQAAGVSLEEYLDQVSARGFGIPLAELLANVLTDAAEAARAGQRRD